MLPLRTRVDLGAMAVKEQSIFPKPAASPSDGLVSYVRHLFGVGSYPSAKMQSMYSPASAVWTVRRKRNIYQSIVLVLVVYASACVVISWQFQFTSEFKKKTTYFFFYDVGHKKYLCKCMHGKFTYLPTYLSTSPSSMEFLTNSFLQRKKNK